MREILFRGKTEVISGSPYNNGKPDGEWVKGYLYDDVGCLKIRQFEIDYARYISYEVNPETVGQYTGLTDKNGKKIFEGDIIQTKKTGLKGEKKYRFVIKYGKYTPLEYCREIYSQWQTIGFYAFDGKCDYQLSCFEDLLEVIGNIHDNPELLEGGERDG